MESPHASSCVILKANINQFCIVDCPGAACNTCGVFARMDVRGRFSTRTCDDNYGEAAPQRQFCITKIYHMSCTHALPCSTLIYLYLLKTVFALMLIAFVPPIYTHVEWFSLVSFWQFGFSLLTSEENLFCLLTLGNSLGNTQSFKYDLF